MNCMRSPVRAYLPPNAHVKRDRGNGLFIAQEIIHSPYFLSKPIEGGWRLYPTSALIGEFEIPEPKDTLCRTLLRFRGLAPGEAETALFCLAAKLLESPEPSRVRALDKAIRQRAAVCMRSGGGGGLYACAMLLNCIGGNGNEA